jgi:predicted RNase H-like HicB family nuclease
VVFPAIPEIVTFGRSLEEARRMAADALKCHLEGLIKDGAILSGPEFCAKIVRKPGTVER